jgi:hypothetical protein
MTYINRRIDKKVLLLSPTEPKNGFAKDATEIANRYGRFGVTVTEEGELAVPDVCAIDILAQDPTLRLKYDELTSHNVSAKLPIAENRINLGLFVIYDLAKQGYENELYVGLI